jgi:hypothetical protein
MVNGVEIVDADGDPTIVPFSRIVRMTKTSQGMAQPKRLYISLDSPMGVGVWIADDKVAETVWGSYRSWLDGHPNP